MRSPMLRAALGATLALVAGAAPAAASTWTVDDDGVQCPNASFSTIQAAIDQAAPHDTIVICPGTYRERSIPTNGTYSPAQVGSRNGLTIQKPITLRGAGADEVFIEPDPSLGSSLAGTAPFLRDGGGNVITIARQSLGASDDNELLADISGVTIRSPHAYVEAGVAYFNTSGMLKDVVVGPIARADADTTTRPHGWGVVQTNSLQGGGPGSGTVRREVNVVDSLIEGYQAGGILFDGGRGADGAPENLAPAGITQYGNVTGTKVVGDGPAGGVAQVGIRFAAGTRGSVTGSEIIDQGWFTTSPATNSSGIQLLDAATGDDPDVPGARALTISGNTFKGNRYALFNAEEDGTTVRLGAPVSTTGNWFGCAAGPVVGGPSNTTINNASYGCQGISGLDAGSPAGPSVELGAIRSTVPPSVLAPGEPTDAAPTVSFREPAGAITLGVGETIAPIVQASDDFGIRSVVFTAGSVTTTKARGPYEFSWTPSAAQAGTTVVLSATATDSSGQQATTSIEVSVQALAEYPAPTPTPAPTTTPTPPPALRNTAAPVILGSPQVGEVMVCLPGTWLGEPTAYSYAWLRAGAPIGGAMSALYELAEADTASDVACRVTATGAGGSTTETSAGRVVRYPLTETDTGLTRQVGSALLDLPQRASASRKTGKGTLGTLRCVRAVATSCTVEVTGTVKIGVRTFALTKTKNTFATAGAVRITLPRAAARLLTGSRTGALAAKVTVRDQTGTKGTVSIALPVRGTK